MIWKKHTRKTRGHVVFVICCVALKTLCSLVAFCGRKMEKIWLKSIPKPRKKTLAYEGFEPAHCTVITAWLKESYLGPKKLCANLNGHFLIWWIFFSSKLINLCRKFKKSKKHKFPQVKKILHLLWILIPLETTQLLLLTITLYQFCTTWKNKTKKI